MVQKHKFRETVIKNTFFKSYFYIFQYFEQRAQLFDVFLSRLAVNYYQMYKL